MRTEHLINFGRRQGVTLVEMLTVVGLMLFLVAIAVPAFNVNNQEKQIVNAARSLQAYITEARAKAILTGLPCGVAFIPYESYPEACVRVQLVETPPVFCGYETNATCTISSSDTLNPVVQSGIPEEWNKAGNKIRFGGKGLWYELGSNGKCTPVNSNNQDVSTVYQKYCPWSSSAPGVSSGTWKTTYEIQAAPIAQAQNYLQAIGMAAPLKFPRGICVDLKYGGSAKGLITKKDDDTPTPVYFLFSPTGQLQEMSINGSEAPRSEAVYFLVGKWDNAVASDSTGIDNIKDYDCCWIKISTETGSVTLEMVE